MKVFNYCCMGCNNTNSIINLIKPLFDCDLTPTNDYNSCNICTVGDFRNSDKFLIRKDVLHIYISAENSCRPKYSQRINRCYSLAKKKLLLGLLDNNAFSNFYPWWYYNKNQLINIDSKKYEISFEERYENEMCAMNHAKWNHREKIVDFYKAKRVNTNGRWGGNRQQDKINIIKHYLINLAIENSKNKSNRYITEKLPEAVVAGCIPIYWGGNLDVTIFNQKRIFNISNTGPKEIDYNDKVMLKDMFDMPILIDGWKEKIDEGINQIKKKISNLL